MPTLPQTDPPALPPILHIRAPHGPAGLRFEWHRISRRLYLIRDTAPTRGELIGENVDTHGAAQMGVFYFLRGWRAALPAEQSPLPRIIQ